MTKNERWLKERRRDHYYRLAMKEGYRSRASFKLIEIAKTFRFIRPRDVVVDLGAAPGGWLQVARELVGDHGIVIGVDLQRIESLPWPNVLTFVADLNDPSLAITIANRLPRKADVFLSDVSPDVSGIWEMDHARQILLAERSLELASALLRDGGNFLAKTFQGAELQAFQLSMRGRFRMIRTIKPKASRRRSAEVYMLGLNFKGS